jgi:hypothetical protein
MNTLIDVFVEPSALVPEFDKKGNIWLAFLVAVVFSTLSLFLTWDITQELSAKLLANSKLSFSSTQKIAIASFGFISQIFGLLLKWTFISFFLITVLQFTSLNKDTELDFGTFFKMTAYSGVILSLESIAKALVTLYRDSAGAIQTMQDLNAGIGLSLFFNRADIGPFLYSFLSDVNPIAFWGYAVLGFLISEHYRLNKATVYASVGGVWLLLALLAGTLQAFGAAQQSGLTR